MYLKATLQKNSNCSEYLNYISRYILTVFHKNDRFTVDFQCILCLKYD